MTIPIVSPQASNANSDSPTRLPASGVTALNYHPLPGHVGNLTAVQLHTLDKLKEELKDQGLFVEERMDDAMLLRWPSQFFCLSLLFLLFNAIVCHFFLRFRFLRARKFDLIKTKEMLVSAEKWRKDFKVDEIVKFVLPFLENGCQCLMQPTETLSLRKKKKSINITLSIIIKWIKCVIIKFYSLLENIYSLNYLGRPSALH